MSPDRAKSYSFLMYARPASVSSTQPDQQPVTHADSIRSGSTPPLSRETTRNHSSRNGDSARFRSSSLTQSSSYYPETPHSGSRFSSPTQSSSYYTETPRSGSSISSIPQNAQGYAQPRTVPKFESGTRLKFIRFVLTELFWCIPDKNIDHSR